jgi:hypothetical protein
MEGRTVTSFGTMKLLVIALCVEAASAHPNLDGLENRNVASVVRAHDVFVSHLRVRNYGALSTYVLVGTTDSLGTSQLLTQYATLTESLRATGVRLLKRQVRRVEMFAAPEGTAAFLRVTSVYSHPLPAVVITSERHTVVAFSRDGVQWRFAIASCFNEDHLRQLVPSYAGTPAFAESN